MGKKKKVKKDYKIAVELAQEQLFETMSDQNANAVTIAILRFAYEEMSNQLASGDFSPAADLEAKKKGTEAIAWGKFWYEFFDKKFQPYYYDNKPYSKKHEEYLDFIVNKLDQLEYYKRYLVDQTNKVFYVQKYNQLTQEVANIILTELMAWSEAHRADDFYLKYTPAEGLTEMLITRQDLVIALREAQDLGMDTTKYNIPVYEEDRPWYVDVVEIGVSFIPVVGSVVAAYEAYSGKDMFGYSLDPIERGIIGASIILPFAGRFAKEGKAIYTASRMGKMYGKDAKVWSRLISSGESLNKNSKAYKVLREASEKIAKQEKLSTQLAKEVNDVVGAEVKSLASGTAKIKVDKNISTAFSKLTQKYKVLEDLDELAVERILAKGGNADHLKGQLLEELLEAKVIRWLQSPFGAKAFGIPESKAYAELQFIPGHMIRDSMGRQISDGMIVRRTGENIYEVLVIFEAKAGKSASRELSLASSKTLSEADEKELNAYAKDIYRELVEQARHEGTTVTKTLDDIKKEIIMSEKGGQVRRDIERLAADEEDNLTKIHFGVDEVSVIVTPKKTKVIGVLPNDVKPKTMEADLEDLGYNFEIMGIDVSSKDLKDMAKIILDPT